MYIEIDKDLIPYKFDVPLANELFTFTIRHNERYDFFTVDVEKDSEVLVVGEKLVLDKPLFASLNDNRFPKVHIIPVDESGVETRISFDNFGEKVFLFVGEDYE